MGGAGINQIGGNSKYQHPEQVADIQNNSLQTSFFDEVGASPSLAEDSATFNNNVIPTRDYPTVNHF